MFVKSRDALALFHSNVFTFSLYEFSIAAVAISAQSKCSNKVHFSPYVKKRRLESAVIRSQLVREFRNKTAGRLVWKNVLKNGVLSGFHSIKDGSFRRTVSGPVVTIRLSFPAASDGLIAFDKQSWRHQAVRGFPVPKVDWEVKPFAFPPQQKSRRRAVHGSDMALFSVAASAGGLPRGETKRWIPHKYQSKQSDIRIIGSLFYQSTPCSINRTVRCHLRAAHTSIYPCLKVQKPLSETEDLTGGGLPFYTCQVVSEVVSGQSEAGLGCFRPITGELDCFRKLVSVVS